MTVTSAAILLFLVMDPLGNIPFFLSALKNVPAQRQTRIIVRELLIALLALVLFLFLGRYALDAMNLSASSLGVAGGVVLMLIALRMIFPTREHVHDEDLSSEPLVVPLAIPAVAGPSSLALVLLMNAQDPTRWPEWLLAVGAAWLATSVILLFGARLSRVMGRRGLMAMERLMGLILVTIAVQMMLTGVADFLREQGLISAAA